MYSLRLFGRHWRLALTAVVSLSIAIAATVMGLSACNALLFRPPGVSEPGTLRLIHVRTAADPFGAASFLEYAVYRDETRAFSELAAYPFAISSLPFAAGSVKEQVVATQVSPNFFSVLGIAPDAGVLRFDPAPAKDIDDIVVGHALWRKLGGDRSLLGKPVRLSEHTVRIIGVVPATFNGMTWGFAPDVWMSLKSAERVMGSPPSALTDRTERWLHMVGRLKPGVSATQAAAEVQLIAAAIARAHADTDTGRSAVLTPLSVTPPGERAWTSKILGALVLIVLLTLVVACANVTNLLLGLSTSRRHEMLVRAALGASRLQLVLPVMRESALLGVVAGLAGYGSAWLALAKLAAFKPSLGAFLPPVSIDFRPDALVFAGTLAISLAAGVAVGVGPALRGAADGLSGAINRELSTAEPRKARIRHALVVIQMAVATVVLVGVGVSIHSLVNLRHVPLGFSARNLVFAGVDMRRSGYDERTGPAFYQRMLERVRATPGVEAVTIASEAPMLGYSTDNVIADGDPPPADGHGAPTPYMVVDDRYFATLGIGVLQGRTFDSRDQHGRTEVVVINATLARQHWPGGDPLGRRLRIENGHRLVEVIGVVPDGRYGDVDEDQLPFMYFALAQHYLPDATIIARSNGARDTVMLALQDVPNIVFGGIGMMTLDDVLGLSLFLPRTIVWTTMVFGVLAFGLAAVGLYSTVFYSVSQRRMEIGIRTALGATPRHLFGLVLRESGWVALAGAVVGLLSGLALLPLASSIFFGIGSIEPLVLLPVACTSAAIALSTTYLVVRPWTRVAVLELLRR